MKMAKPDKPNLSRLTRSKNMMDLELFGLIPCISTYTRPRAKERSDFPAKPQVKALRLIQEASDEDD